MSTIFTPPPPPAAAILYTSSPYSASSSSSSSSSIMIVVIIIASAVIISASIYLLLRVVSKRFRRSFSTTADDVVSRRGAGSSSNRMASIDLLDSLPLFTFRSVVARNLNSGGDCAVCLSMFEPRDQLRLLPLCCHAFHADCIDKWIVSNQTCPLCRSTVLPYGGDAHDKIISTGNVNSSSNSFRERNGGSFRIELGSISLRRNEAAAEETARRTYSIGSFEYVVDDCVCEVAVGCTSHRSEKESSAAEEDVGGRRNWLREYVERVASMSSRTMSFRSSGRFFSDAAVVPEDLEANEAGEEISEMFRWISGV